MFSTRLKEVPLRALFYRTDYMICIELSDFIDDIILENPDFNIDTLHLAVKAAINLEKSRAGVNLLSKLPAYQQHFFLV